MKALQKSSLREIRKSLGRYLAILAIVALGVGFFCGLRVCRDAMIETGDDYLNRQNMYDYRLISTLGFDQSDAEAFATIEGVTAAAGAVSQDALVEVEGTDTAGVLAFHSLTENVNEISLTAGRLPDDPDEMVGDASLFSVDSIGKTVRIADTNDEDTLDMFAYREYTIVGLGNSPTYMNYERGSTSLGNGTVMGFAYIPYEGFDCDYYTEIYVRLDTEGVIYSDEYQTGVEQYEGQMTDSGEARAYERFETLLNDALAELSDGTSEFDEAYADYLAQRDEAERELRDARDELITGGGQIAVNEQLLADSEAELRDARAQYNDGRAHLDASERQLESAEAETYAQLDATQAELTAQQTAVSEGIAQIEQSGVLDQEETLSQALPQLEEGLAQAQAAREELVAVGPALREGIAAAEANIQSLTKEKQQAIAGLEAQYKALEDEIAELEAELATLAPGDDARIDELNALLENLRTKKQQLSEQLEADKQDYETRIGQKQSERDKLAEQETAAENNVASLRTQRDQAVGALQGQLSQVQSDLAGKRTELAGLDPVADADRIAVLQGEIGTLEEQESALNGQISSTQKDYDSRIAQAESAWSDLSGRLSTAETELSALQTERDDALAALNNDIADVNAQITQAESELATLTPSPDADRRAEILRQIAANRAEMTALEGEIATTGREYDEQISQEQDTKKSLEEKLAQHEATYDQALAQLDAQIKTLTEQRDQTKTALETIASYREMEAALPQIEEGLAQVEAGRAQADSEFAAARAQINSGRAELRDALAQIEEGEQELEDGRAELESAKADLIDGRAEYEEGRAEADSEFIDAEQELADARAELADAREKISEIEEPDVYVLDRSANIGYACFESDSQIVESISTVFPLFFFMVAALVCMTTMTRMVDEQRTQIGVLKALGYTPGAIMGKFVFYSGSAATIGSIIGFFFGSTVFPKVIWMAYSLMYGFADIELVFDWGMGALALGAALLCSVGATWFSVRRELGVAPAELLRPAAPKAGKRILLERIRPLWRRLSFMHKLTVRNIFRYKKRLVMMIIGIGGCTALLVTGLGIRDSISDVVNYQFDEITLYDVSVTFIDVQDEAAQEAFRAAAGEDAQSLFVHESTVDASAGGTTKSVYLVATQAESLDGFIDMHMDEEPVAMPGEGEAVISQGLAETLGVQVGDTITVRDSDMNPAQLTISGVFENYIYNYVFARPETMEAEWGYAPEVKSAYVAVTGDADPRAVAAELSALDGVGNVSANIDMRDRVNSMMESLDYIVMLVVFSAGTLAFIVLYNLTNINITERTREIATVKVLGFFPRETASYVFSENFLLCFISALAGLPLGKALHAFVMSQIRIDMIRFDVRVSLLSYGLAVVLTFAFAILVNFALRFKLEKINMAESLKTVE